MDVCRNYPQLGMQISRGVAHGVKASYNQATEQVRGVPYEADHVVLMAGDQGPMVVHCPAPPRKKLPDMRVQHTNEVDHDTLTFTRANLRTGGAADSLSARVERDSSGHGHLLVSQRNPAGIATIAVDLGMLEPGQDRTLAPMIPVLDVCVEQGGHLPGTKISLLHDSPEQERLVYLLADGQLRAHGVQGVNS